MHLIYPINQRSRECWQKASDTAQLKQLEETPPIKSKGQRTQEAVEYQQLAKLRSKFHLQQMGRTRELHSEGMLEVHFK